MSDQPARIIAPREGDGMRPVRGLQWLLLCPHMNAREKNVLQTLCSLVSEERPARSVLLSEIAALTPKRAVDPGEEPEFMTPSGIVPVIQRLSRLGQITDHAGDEVVATSRRKSAVTIVPYSYPRHECEASRTVGDGLARLRGEDPWFPTVDEPFNEPPKKGTKKGTKGKQGRRPKGQRAQDPAPKDAQNFVPDAQNFVPDAQNSVPDAQNSGANCGLTCENAAPHQSLCPSFGQSSSLSEAEGTDGSADVVDAEVVEDERETTRPPQQQHDTTGRVTAAWAEAYTAATGQAPTAEAVAVVRRDVVVLLKAGRTADALIPVAVDMAQKNAAHRLVSKHLGFYTPVPQQAAPSRTAQRRQHADDLIAKFAAMEAANSTPSPPALTGGLDR